MPPKSDPLGRDETRILRAWIDQGADWPETAAAATSSRREMVVTAEDRQHWSYRPLSRRRPPVVHDANWCRTPIDRFVLATLRARGIRPNAQADRRTLDPPGLFRPARSAPFTRGGEGVCREPGTRRLQKLVDRLLASPHYGERWGRHWLDVARYADSDGLESDADRPTAYHYRDFVIRAMNDDMSYRDVRALADRRGRIRIPTTPSALAATGFLAAAPTEVLTVPMEEEKLRFRFNELDDMAVTTVSTFLGLTLGCALPRPQVRRHSDRAITIGCNAPSRRPGMKPSW